MIPRRLTRGAPAAETTEVPRSRSSNAAPTRLRVRAAASAVLVAVFALLGLAPGARADCTPDSATAQTGDDVVCSGTTVGGFDAGPGVEDLRIHVEPTAEVENSGAGTAAIEINSNNPGDSNAPGVLIEETTRPDPGDPNGPPIVERGLLRVSGDGGAGVRGADPLTAGDFNYVRNDGVIDATVSAGTDIIGIDLGDDGVAENSGSIELRGDRSIGIRVGNRGTGYNEGTIDATIDTVGVDVIAIDVGDFGTAENAGLIRLRGAGATGLRVGDEGLVYQNGNLLNDLSTAGADVIGIDAGERAIVVHTGVTNLHGHRNIGIRVGNDGSVSVAGSLSVRDPNLGDGSNDIDDPIAILLGDGVGGLATGDQSRGLIVTGTVTAIGRNAIGAQVGASWNGANGEILIESTGRLRASGDDAIGLLVGDDSEVEIRGSVAGLGADAIAVHMGDQTMANNDDLKLVVTGAVIAQQPDAVGVSLGRKAGDGLTNVSNSFSPSLELGIMGQIVAPGFEPTIRGDLNSGPLVLFRDSSGGLNHIVIANGSILEANELNFFEPNRAIAIQGTDAGERIDNYGTLGGKVLLEGGNDYFELGPTGTFVGDMSVNAGDGDDTLELTNRWGLLVGAGEATFEFDDYRNFERLVVNDATPRKATGFSNGNAFEEVDIAAGSQLTVVNPLAFSPNDDTFANRGAFAGGAELGAGNDTFTLGAGATLSGRSLVDGGADLDALVLEGDSSGAIDELSGDALAGFESLQLMAGSRWRIGGDLRSANPGVALRAETGSQLVVQQPLELDGPLDLEPGAGLQIELQRTNAAAYVLTTDTITIDATSTLDVVLAGSLDPGQLTLLSGESLSGTFDPLLIELPDSPVYRFSDVVQDALAGTVTLFVDRDPFAQNREITDGYVSEISAAGPSPDLDVFIDALNALPTDEYLETLDLLHPETYDVQTSVQLALARQFQQTLLERPGHCIAPANSGRRDPRTKVPCRPRPLDVWSAGYGVFRTRDGDEGHVSWSDDGGGLVLGIDHRQGSSLLLSTSLGGAHANSDVDGVGKGRFTSLDAGALAAWTRGPALVQGFFTYGHGWHQAYRNVAFSGVRREAEGEWESNRVSVGGEASWTFATKGLDITPSFEADWAWVKQPGFTETGASPLDLRVDGATDTVTTLRVGVGLGTSLLRKGYFTDFLERADGVWQPRLSVKWRQVVSGDDRALTSSIVGAPTGTGDTTVYSDDAGQGFEIGAGVWFTPKSANRVTIGVSYDAFVWTDIISHDLIGRVSYSF